MSITPQASLEALVADIANEIEVARGKVRQVINSAMVQSYWQVGRLIVEHEQAGESRAAHGKQQLQALSLRLTAMQQILELCEQQLVSEQGEPSIVEPNSNLGRAMNYFIKHFTQLSAFCRIPKAPIDNNEAERALKLVIRGRKNSLFHQTAVGANIADVICSVLAICHEQCVDAQHYLVAVQQNQLQVKASPEKWLPWNYPTSSSAAETDNNDADVCVA